MSQLRTVDVQEVLARAGEALSKASSDMVQLNDVEVLSNDQRRNFIARAAARYAGGSTRSVILKATRSPTFLAERAPGRGHGSALLAGDVAGGIMVFEDLGAHLSSLVDPLRLLENGISDLLVRWTHPARCCRPSRCGLSGRDRRNDPLGTR